MQGFDGSLATVKAGSDDYTSHPERAAFEATRNKYAIALQRTPPAANEGGSRVEVAMLFFRGKASHLVTAH